VRGRDHLLLSAALTAPIAYLITRSPETTTALALAVGAAALLPDLDHGASMGAGLLRVRWLSRLAQSTVGHRGPASHSLAACVAWAVVWGFATAVVLAPAGQAPSLRAAGVVFGVVLAGSAAHVVEDWLPIGSRSGVPILWPMRKERLKFRLHPARCRRAATSL
jgi:ABC-type branched-subunit amino acid transport system permease subunit